MSSLSSLTTDAEMVLANQPPPLTGPSAGGDRGLAMPLSFYFGLVWRRRWHILSVVVVVTTAVLLLSLGTAKQYESVTLVRVDPATPQVVGQDTRQVSGSDADMLVSTDQQVVTSPDVLLELANNLHLASNPEFKMPQSVAGGSSQVQQDWLLNQLRNRISVSRPIGTLLLQIGFRSHSPQLSSDAANALGAAFLDHEYRTRQQVYSVSSRYMSDQLDDLRAKMEKSQAALVEYEISSDVVNPDDKNNPLQTALAQTNADLGEAQSARMKAEGAYEVARGGDRNALLAMEPGKQLQPLVDQLTRDQRVLAQMGQIYGPNYVLYQQQQQAVAHDNQVLRDAQAGLTAQLYATYQSARTREQLVQAQMATETKALNDFNLRAVRYTALKGEADSDAKIYYDLLQRIKEEGVSSGFRAGDGLRVASAARPELKPVSPRVVMDTGLAFLLSLLGGIAGALLLGLSDRSISRPDQIEQWFGTPALVSLPQDESSRSGGGLSPTLWEPVSVAEATDGANAVGQLKRRSHFREAVLSLHSAIQFSNDRLEALAITSSLPGEGKSTITSNLAAAYSTLGGKIIIIDADLRKPNIHRIFGLSNRVGLSQVLQHQRDLAACVQAIPNFPNLEVLCAGPIAASPLELLHARLGELIDSLRGKYDHIFVDCPPVLGFADAAVVANVVDGVVLVVHAGHTDRNLVAGSIRQLRGARAGLIGIALNRVSAGTDSYYGDYFRYYGSYYGREEDEAGDE